MTARRLPWLVAALAAALSLAAGCEEDPPESAFETPTPGTSPNPEPTPVSVTLPAGGTLATVTGRIEERGEADVFTFDLAAGETVRIDVDAQGLEPSSANLDAFLTVYAPGGGILAVSDDGTNLWDQGTSTPGALRDPYLVVEATDPGTYTAVLEDAAGGGADNEEFDYRIAFSLVQPVTLEGGLACADAVPLPALAGTGGVLSIRGTLAPTSTDTCCNTEVIPCVGSRVSSTDVTYTATLSSGERIQITRSGAAFDGAVYVTTACTGGSNASIINSCEAGADGADDTDGVVFTPTVTGTYFIFVDAVSGSSGAFTLDLRRM